MYRKIFYLFLFYGAIIHNSVAAKESLVVETKQTVHDEITLDQSPELLQTEKQILEIPSQKSHILIFHNAGTRSHLIAMNAVAEGLVEHGHQVTSVIYAKSNIVNDNYKEILIEDRIAEVYKKFSKMYMESGGTSGLNLRIWYEGIKLMRTSFKDICTESITESPELMKMIEERAKVDVVIMLGSCGSFLAHLFDTPLIMFSPAGPLSLQLAPGLGNPINPTVQPHIMAPFIEPMTFIERLSNVFLTGIMDLYMTYTDSIQVESLREHFGNDIPDFYTIMKERSAFALSNSHFVTHGSWPLYPNLVEIGGIHCKPGKQLPPDIKDFMDAHPEGVAYVSFGSALSPSAMTDGQKSVFRETFSELKNVPIIWKWDDDDLSGIPKNVMVRKWLPQNDLLAHPNLKAFVTHGGLLSTQEALFHNVPLVGVPISNDQKPNLLRAQRHGYATMLSLQTMTKEDLKSAINKAMNDEDMRASIKKMHDLFTDDQDDPPVERAVRAVEYVIKHNGADFLKPTATMTMSWYEERGFDIFIFVVLVVSISCFITLKLCCCCIRRCCYKKTKQD